MRNRLATIFRSFPAQFWLVAFGVLLSSAGSSLIWPFQLVYISETLQAPLTTAGTLVSLSSFVGLVVSFLGGSIADRFGRKPIMFLAQTAHGLAYLLMSHAETYAAFILPMTILGAAMPFYAIGSDAMMADLLPPQRRASAFAILRMTNNAGFAIGPTLGGLLVVRSYTLAFYAAAAAMFFYSLLLFFFTHETLQRQHDHPQETLLENLLGYRHVFADRRFIAFVALVAFGMIGPLMMWVFLAVYTKTYYGLSETLYAWIPTTNALMCVFVQYFVTLFTRRHPPTQMIALGMFVYALGVGSVAWMSDFWGFWTSMVVFTLGELILIPTGTTYAAGLAPETLRGRYLSLYWLTWGLARTLAPLLGGVLNDLICPQAIWYGGLILGLLSAAALWRLSRAPSSYLMTRDKKNNPKEKMLHKPPPDRQQIACPSIRPGFDTGVIFNFSFGIHDIKGCSQTPVPHPITLRYTR